MNTTNYCVIMAGGIGSRFWPSSTSENPKQFLDILGTGKSLLQQTVERFMPIVGIQNILILTSNQYKELVAEQLPQIGREQIICEPARRNTAPCILYAALKIWKKEPKASFIISPADHLIKNEKEFQAAINLGIGSCNNFPSRTITLGITPTYPSTGFGYIEQGINAGEGLSEVVQFIEKPNVERAQEMLSSGNYYWNSGLFIWNVEHLLSLYKKHQPKMFELFFENSSSLNTENEEMKLGVYYPISENISVDYAILERANDIYVISGNYGWSDLGSWSSLKEHIVADKNGTTTIGTKKYFYKNSRSNIVVAPKHKKIIISGLEKFIVVDSEDGLLICPLDKEQEIKNYLVELQNMNQSDSVSDDI